MLFKLTLFSLLRRTFTLFLISNLLFSQASQATENSSLEIKLKAAYIYNFLRFVEWPTNENLTSNICIYGIKENYRSAFNAMSTLSKKTKKLHIKLLGTNEELNILKTCQLIFITDLADYKTKDILDFIKNGNNLTIGESSKFIQQGGMINFIRVKDKIKFEINAEAVKAANLKIPAKVLRISERLVRPKNNE